MSYQVLARKWRPKSFDALVGQDHVVRALTHALDTDRLHHAYLFTGTRGVGKTTLARILAKALNCEAGVSSKPCGVCGSCQEIDGGRFIDYVEMDAASNRGVEDMTQLLERASYAPARGRYKVYMIDEVHQLTGHAFNAMLKTLEEPPEHIKFILATTDPQKIPVTVLSRCLQFNLKQMAPAAITDHLARILEAEGVAFEQAALRHLAKAAAGSMRDALSLLDQAIAHGAGALREAGVQDMLGTVSEDYLFAVLDGLRGVDTTAMIRIAEQMDERSLSFDSALQELATLLHRIALQQLAPQAIDDESERVRLTPYAASFDPEFLQLAYQIVIQGRRDLALAPDEYAGFTMTLLRLAAFRPDTPGETEAPSARAGVAAVAPVATRNPAQPNVAAALPSPAATQTDRPCDAWHELIQRRKLGGMVRELAQHCELVQVTDEVVQLRLPHAHRALLINSGPKDKLQAELQAHYGKPLKLRVEIGETRTETPAQRRNRQQRSRHERAVEALEQDPFVRDVIDMFDATLSESSIKPL